MLRRDIESPVEVKALNRCLHELGYKMVDPDSTVFDLNTEISVYDFQRLNDIVVDGIVGPITQKMLSDTSKDAQYYSDPRFTLFRVPYYSQRDNHLYPKSACNVTCLAMALTYLGHKWTGDEQLEDYLMSVLTGKEGQRYYLNHFPSYHNKGYRAASVHGMLVWIAHSFGFQASSLYVKDLSDISFGETTTTILSGSFTGAGHLVTVVGSLANEALIVHDPYGDWNQGYKNQNGAFRLYSYSKLTNICTRSGGIPIIQIKNDGVYYE